MKHWLKSHPLKAGAIGVVVAVLATLVATGRTPLYAPTFTPKTMTTIPVERRTQCIGRYLVDLPTDFGQISGQWGDIEFYYGLDKNFKRVYVSVESGLFTPEQFSSRIAERHKELNEEINEGDQSADALACGEDRKGCGNVQAS